MSSSVVRSVGSVPGASMLLSGRGAASARRVDVGGIPALRELGDALRATVVRQDGVATTAQLAAGGVERSVVARRVRSGHWQRAVRGVVVLQSGPPTWRQLARAALLAAGPGAALSHRSAGFVHGLLRDPGSGFVVSVPAQRYVVARPGLTVRRRRTMPRSSGSLRSVDIFGTVLDLVHETADDDAVVAVLCDAARLRVPTSQVVDEAAGRTGLRHRALLLDVLGDPTARVESPLEHRYDRDVERAHGLPRSLGQVADRVDGRRIRSDRRYAAWGVRVELDGRLVHAGRVDADVWRDNAVRVERGDVTLRYRWRHVAGAPCATAAQLAAALRARGWPGSPARCSPDCRVGVQGSWS
ncbi:type IV toxin-antitoxin system AbiEi family antitoxin domain-containing protein [Cellulomonas wangsupingiae]|uniref:Type IV toxin-antitoxin system AbiEi family antitoxin domain-containing protein n=1 Tax=Cellulomonas wangsupingiae TaxID=2968085 RepID=A0ABY5K3W3_9CELL|nr:type IV toxin-antitoxin system AbiEi family antitoxin domain-containing protein [Cellulomonas wangsupingiae]MCC2333891.1 type IV toxin-antitoxin system AbiEi family antitoxin domain-containing protein [Cellulomonas wangsupingiae]UUI65149.1 type IV toxin-antitoxin system AbiEi family antitoxin domain-containing protein [Cellulomonas wangsupingiae]